MDEELSVMLDDFDTLYEENTTYIDVDFEDEEVEDDGYDFSF